MPFVKRTIWLIARAAVVLLLLVIGVAVGYWLTSGSPAATAAGGGQAEQDSSKWYCSMDPQIIRDKPGDCPICGMDLIPLPEDMQAEITPRQLAVSESAAKLMDIQTSAVERKFVAVEIPMVGKVDFDETRVKTITAWAPGRIDRLYVDFTGTRVAQDDHLVYLYSPELVSAQAELLQAALAAAKTEPGGSDYVKQSAKQTLEASRQKLRLLGLKAEQIQEIEASGEAVTHLTIYAPIGGVVIDKMATEGVYVTTGTPIYKVADLSRLWVKLDAYESDLPWIHYGQEVHFTTESHPGETFEGRISFISPTLDSTTRTVKVRVNVPNPNGALKPEMFVRAVVHSRLAQDGQVMDPNMAGKWICPMHPSVVKVRPADCDICGMDLVTTESLGYVTAEAPEQPPLVIPATAPLITGKRAVVYVQKSQAETPTFEGREIVLGPRAGDYYIVESGLKEGDRVVTQGNFKIDSAMQIQAKPSMMNPTGDTMPAGHKHNMDSDDSHDHD